MNHSAPGFCCPDCYGNLEYQGFSSRDSDRQIGCFFCRKCSKHVPSVDGFPLFPESFNNDPEYEKRIRGLVESTVASRDSYLEFVYQQSLRPVFDPYAAYYPFNEGLQGFLRLTRLIRSVLQPGSRILDLNSRTGWTGELLASLFPEQRVTSLWEGNQGFLGYSGFHFWLPPSRRTHNLDFIFNSDKSKLPFADGSFDLIFGFDFLHHHVNERDLRELLRISGGNSPLIFPHVHTNHSVPEPFFERGGDLISARDWCHLFSGLEQDSHRVPLVISELEIYNSESFALQTREEIIHYNCCVMFVPLDWKNRRIDFCGHQPIADHSFMFTNPLLSSNLDSGKLSIDPSAMDQGVRHLLDRHPAIEDDLAGRLEPPLCRMDRQVLYWANKGLTCTETAARLEISMQELDTRVQALTQRRILMAFPVSSAIWEMQQYARNRYLVSRPESEVFSILWADLPARYPSHPVLINHDGSEFSQEHVALFVNATRGLLGDHGVNKENAVLVCSDVHLEILITCWAAWLEGVCVVMVNPEAEQDSILQTLKDIPVSLVFCDRHFAWMNAHTCIAFDDSGNDTAPAFSEAIEPFFDQQQLPPAKVDESDTCLILSTSGSTGKPKRVKLSQGSLYRSGESLSRCMGFQRQERMLSLGPMYSMSGLRNPATGALHAGATIVVPTPQQQKLFPASLRLITDFSVNVVSAVPAFIENIYNFILQDRKIALPGVRLLMSTASKLDNDQKSQAVSALDLAIVDYYGLTETGGICITQWPDRNYAAGSIGETINCLAEIRDAHGNSVEPGDTGELFIYSDNLMSGYVPFSDDCGKPENSSGEVRIQDGWLGTGDQARFLPDGDIELLGRYDGASKNRQGEFPAAEVTAG